MNIGKDLNSVEKFDVKSGNIPNQSEHNIEKVKNLKENIDQIKSISPSSLEKPILEDNLGNQERDIKELNPQKQHKIESLIDMRNIPDKEDLPVANNVNQPEEEDIDDLLGDGSFDQTHSKENDKNQYEIETLAPIEANADLFIRAEDVTMIVFLDEEHRHIDLEPANAQAFKKMDERLGFIFTKKNQYIVRGKDKEKFAPLNKHDDFKEWEVAVNASVDPNAAKQFKERLKNREAFKSVIYISEEQFHDLCELILKRQQLVDKSETVSNIYRTITLTYEKREFILKIDFSKYPVVKIDGKDKEAKKPVLVIFISAQKKLSNILQAARERHDENLEVIAKFVLENLEKFVRVYEAAAKTDYQLMEQHSIQPYQDLLKRLEQAQKIPPEAA